MGAKDSKPSFISYEDAVKRVSDSELRRIREAFKRCAGANGTALSLEAFVHEVLCDGVPYEVAEWLYQGCGGTKRGIAFKDLLCGIVVLTKGNIEEKIKFLWTLYTNNQSDNGTYIYKREFARTLHLENTSLPVTGAQRSAEILLGLFGQGDRVTFDQFRSWLLIHKDATVLSKWLLSDLIACHDLETPTFYQSLAGVTHLEERDIIELEKCFWSLRHSAPTGELDLESLSPLLSPPLPAAAVAGTFLAFDVNRDGHVDFKELCCGLSAACRGPRTERLKFCFKIFDVDSDGLLDEAELAAMVDILCSVANEHAADQESRASTPEGEEEEEPAFAPDEELRALREQIQRRAAAEEMIQLSESSGETGCPLQLSQEDFLIWAVERAGALVSPFLALLFETCHVVLGLRPQCRHRERDIVLGCLRRWSGRGLRAGQFWFLVEAAWWRAWAAWARAPAACCPPPAASTESMGSLWRCETASLGSGSGSGSSSGHGSGHGSGSGQSIGHERPPRPGPIDNSRLIEPSTEQTRSLTGEGALVRRDVPLAQHRDFELLPDPLWRALAHWYSAPCPLPRQVIRPPNSDVELELYPLQLMIYRHVPSTQRPGPGLPSAPPERQLAYTAAFSRLATVKQVSEFLCSVLGLAREDVRLWALGGGGGGGGGGEPALLDDERRALAALAMPRPARLLLERRAPDLTWPEEIGALSGGLARRSTLAAPELAGATGLHNLGNTCYMNAALQAVWNTGPLNRYFNSGLHLYELNTSNPLGTRGALALRLGELCKEVWSRRARSVAPLRVRWCVARHARALAGGGQHDAQELLAWLLDTLHEDLKRPPPAPGGEGAEAAPAGDQAAASAAWARHVARNDSILTELFCGQLKSRVKCDACAHESVTFDVFNMLSLPLPMEASIRLHVRVILQDGSVPVRYGARVSAEGCYGDLKRNLSKLCGLPPHNMLLTELNGAVLGRIFPDSAKVCATPGDLYAYELPHGHADGYDNGWTDADAAGAPEGEGEGGGRGRGAWGTEVSVGGNTDTLCMPALFCFKRSQSEVLMSQSPPSTFLRSHSIYTDSTDASKSSTLPKESRRAPPSPSPSARSLDSRRPPPPGAAGGAAGGDKVTYIMAVHRKQCRADAYFLSSARARPALFGAPVLVALRPGASGRALYAAVWAQLARLLSPAPAAERNHAHDCDDSLGYEFPFTLRLVGRPSGAWCARCPWHKHCRGCPLPATSRPLLPHGPNTPRKASSANTSFIDDLPHADSPIARAKLQRQASARGINDEGPLEFLPAAALGGGAGGLARGAMLAVDWEPTALHLRYQAARERRATDHESVQQEAAAAAACVDLGSCLRAFTARERLEARYPCCACAAPQPATKTLQLWRAPPILIIHLKRFQYVNNKWIKSQKVVNFPFEDFDLTDYLASVPRETILRAREIARLAREPDTGDEGGEEAEEAKERSSRRTRLESTSLRAAPVRDDDLQDLHEHRLAPGADPLDLKYRLYAVVSHSGQLSGGHYVSSARHPTGAWLSYNDSSCRELPASPPGSNPHIDPAAAYLLFYERQGLDYEQYLPDVTGKEPVVKDSEALDPDESDLKKMCVVA